MHPAKLILLFALIAFAQSGIYQEHYDEAYRIAVAMSLEQKIGQTLQVDFGALQNKKVTD
jgi:hypothetical protein